MSSSRFHEHKVQLRQEHLPFDVESWYGWLGAEQTFATHFFAISVDEARALLAWYHHRYNSRAAPTRDDVVLLTGLRDRLVPTLDETGKDWFVRLSSRSPKDAGKLDRAQYEAELRKWRLELLGDGCDSTEADDDPGKKLLEANAQMLAFSYITWSNQKTTGGAGTATGVLEHLVSSERVLVDLIEATEAEELFSMKIIVRQWEATLRHDYEFRGFVHGGELRALSQYNHYCFFPHVLREKEALETSIKEYWETTVRKLIPLDQYVVDFAVLACGRVVVVELNPFKSSTGACLFSWNHHRDVLENGPFEFRVHESTPPELPSFVEHAVPEAFRQSESDVSLPCLEDLQRMHGLQGGRHGSCLIL